MGVHRGRYSTFGALEQAGAEGGYFFTGREWDPETGLHYYRARFYDPKPGRFISEDPIRFCSGINFYGYVRNTPASRTDPFGLVDWDLGLCGLADVIAWRIGLGDAAKADLEKRVPVPPQLDTTHCMANCSAASRGILGEMASTSTDVREAWSLGLAIRRDQPGDVLDCHEDTNANRRGLRAGLVVGNGEM